MFRLLTALLLAPLVVSCTLTPDYERPELELPEDYVEPMPGGDSIANMHWWDLLQDDQLDALIRTAL